MSFEDDMIEDGFHDAQEYLEYICDKAMREDEERMYNEYDDFEQEWKQEWEIKCKDTLDEGESFMDYGKYSKAIECFSRIEKIEIKEVYGWNITHPLVLIGNCHMKLKQYLEAIECYKKYIKLVDNFSSEIQSEKEEDESYWYNGHYADDNDTLHAEAYVYEQTGNCYKELSQDDNAIKFYQQAGNYYYEDKKYSEAIMCYEKTIDLDSTYIDVYYNLIECHDRLDNDLAVKNSYKRLIENNPEYIDGYNDMIRFLEQKGMFTEATDYRKELIKNNPNNTEAYKNIGNYNKNITNYLDAIPFYIKAIELDSSNTDAYYDLISCYKNIGKNNEVSKCYTKLIRNNPDNKEAIENTGDHYYELKQYSKAIKFYKKINNYRKMGDCYCIEKQYPEAIECYKQIVRWDEEDIYKNLDRTISGFLQLTISVDKAYVYEKLGYCFKEIKKYSESFICYQNAGNYYIQKNENNWKESISKALLCYLNLSEIKSNDSRLNRNIVSIYADIGYCYSELGRGTWEEKRRKFYYQKAIFYYQKGLKINPNDNTKYNGSTLHYEIGHIYLYDLHLYSEAIPYYLKAIEQNNNSSTRQNLKNCYKSLTQYTKAIIYSEDEYEAKKYYEEAIKMNPNDEEAYINMGEIYKEMSTRRNRYNECYPDNGDYAEKAIFCYEKAIEINSNNVQIYKNIGFLYVLMADNNENHFILERNDCYFEAIDYYERALEITPNDAEIYRNIGNCYCGLNDKTKAIDYFNKVIESNPNYLNPKFAEEKEEIPLWGFDHFTLYLKYLNKGHEWHWAAKEYFDTNADNQSNYFDADINNIVEYDDFVIDITEFDVSDNNNNDE